ncbi:DUF732 domain-containing protein [Streptomyces flavofungini]|uniref:DUF732 domain-containing protein n=1 Tax=Streptomyces flavofungini TaxID=68200 RepID=UPI0025B0597C|nr:DUF732 domain-containing protein [Streptomyces flavofungini]WJV49181.1 DUF732 domain-containing protein [Streptomyces flavofungini]
MKRKTRNWLIGGVALFAIGAVGSLFQDDDSSEAEAKPKPSVTESVKKESKPDEKPSKPAAGSGIPSPDPAQTARLIRALSAIEPGLVAKEDRAVSRARNVCSDIKGGKGAATVRANAKYRYEGGTVPSLTDDQAADIVTAVKSSFCG